MPFVGIGEPTKNGFIVKTKNTISYSVFPKWQDGHLELTKGKVLLTTGYSHFIIGDKQQLEALLDD